MSDQIGFKSHYVDTPEVTLHVVTAGDPDNQAIILLHGFPEYWAGWREVAKRLVEDGYYTIIPDQRGYNTSSTPFWISSYRVDNLVMDVMAIIEWSGRSEIILAGHDWGAAVAWAVASTYPDRIKQLIIVNVPHPRAFKRHLNSSFSQLRKSWYMFFFQIPLIPQLVLQLFNFRFLRDSMKKSALPDTFTDKQMKQYTKAWSQSGVAPMINWYRATFRLRTNIKYDHIHLPVLIIWGRKDQFLAEETAEMSLKYCSNADLRYIDEATHWVLHEFPDEVAVLIQEFIDTSLDETL